MEAVFLKILNMSITASWLVLAVIALRFLLKKAPKAFLVLLWGLVGVRLILPFSFESVMSLIPSAETVPSDIVYSQVPEINSGIGALNSAINPIISETLAPNEISSMNPMEVVTIVASAVWVIGIAAMLLYTLTSFLLFRRKVREAAPLRENIYLCDGIGTPFILGVIHPRIYLPSSVSQADAQHVIAHETAHIKRRDYLWKPLGFLFLTVYWFNPVLWIAYILLCRDIELACDEKVIRDKSLEIKKSYSEALVNCSVPRKMITACPLAFGEGSVKGRIKSVLNYKKPAFWIIIVSIIACVAVAVCFLTNPKTAKVKLPENFNIIETDSSFSEVSLSVQEVQLDAENPHIKVEWKNESEYVISYGEIFDIYFYEEENDVFVSCKRDDLAFALPEYLLDPGKTVTETFSLWGFDLTKEGNYRFITPASYSENSVDTIGYIWVDFVIGTEDSASIAEAFGAIPSYEVTPITFNATSTKIEKTDISAKLPDDVTYYSKWDKNSEWIRIAKATDPNVGIYAKNSDTDTLLLKVENEYYTLKWQKARFLEQMIRLFTADIDGDGEQEIVAVFDTPSEPHWNKKELHVIDRVGNELVDINFPLEEWGKWILENSETGDGYLDLFGGIVKSESITAETRLENVISLGILRVKDNKLSVSVSVTDDHYSSQLAIFTTDLSYGDGKFTVEERAFTGFAH